MRSGTTLFSLTRFFSFLLVRLLRYVLNKFLEVTWSPTDKSDEIVIRSGIAHPARILLLKLSNLTRKQGELIWVLALSENLRIRRASMNQRLKTPGDVLL